MEKPRRGDALRRQENAGDTSPVVGLQIIQEEHLNGVH